MIEHPAFIVEPWQLRETELHLDVLAQTESVFALSNGHIGLRGNLDEGEPNALPGTYLNAFYETRPLPYAETAYGNPEAGQTVVNVTNPKIMRLLVDDEPFDVRYGHLDHHERVLDFRAGVLRRRVDWTSPAGRSVRVQSTRLVSFAQRSVAAIRYEVAPLDGPVRLVVQSELVANEPVPTNEADPRASAALAQPLRSEYAVEHDLRVKLVHSTARSGLRMAAGMDHLVRCDAPVDTEVEALPDLGRVTVAVDVDSGDRLCIVKYVAYGWSSQRTLPAVRDQVDAALAQARHTGWDGLLEAQRAYLDDFWERGDVELAGDAELQQALRFALFHVLQAGARAEQRAIPAKGLTGPGYDGHTFWDSEAFVLPVLTYTCPGAAADALRWRHATLDLARDRARQLNLAGAAFPWRTIRGHECSGYWPAGTAAFHISGDVAAAVERHRLATEDERFDREIAVELLVETARLWRALGHHDRHGAFRIDGVTGPDEYTAVMDNNVFTNLVAQRNLAAASEAIERHPGRAAELGVDAEEAASWRDAANAIVVPYDEEIGVHPQSEGFTQHAPWDFSQTREDQYPLFLHFPYFDLYRKRVVKQADLVLALYLYGDAFSAEEKERNFAYYEAITVRDSSLSSAPQAVVAAETGHLDLAYDYFAEAALMDLDDIHHNTRDGLHIASLAGAWIAAVGGFGGMRDHGGELRFAPELPDALTRLAFRLVFRERRLLVEVEDRQVRYTLRAGEPLTVRHYDEPLELVEGEPQVVPVRERRQGPHPSQPPGRAPARRHPVPYATRP